MKDAEPLLREDTRCANCGAYPDVELERLVAAVEENRNNLPAAIRTAWEKYSERNFL